MLLGPPEILSHIFRFCIPGYCRHLLSRDSDAVSSPQHQLMSPLLLGAVCQAWRQIAWTTPRLWIVICMKFCPSGLDNDIRFQLAEEWFGRSSQLRLAMHIASPASFTSSPLSQGCSADIIPWTRLIQRYLPRCRTLFFKVPDDTLRCFNLNAESSVLRTVKTKCNNINLSSCTNLLQLGSIKPLQVFIEGPLPSQINISWANAYQIELTTIGYRDSMQVFRLAPNLQSCRIVAFDCGQIESSEIITHVRLQMMTLRANSSHVAAIFDRLNCPSLQVLVCQLLQGCLPVDNLISFLHRSASSLTCLVIDVIYDLGTAVESLQRLFEATPALIHLHLAWVEMPQYQGFLASFFLAELRSTRDRRAKAPLAET